MRIGYVGLGNMGTPIFLNLVEYCRQNDLPAPCAWNIDQSRYEEMQARDNRMELKRELVEVVGQSDILFTCLLNDPVAEDVYRQFFASGHADGVIFVDQSSLKPKTSGGSSIPIGLTPVKLETLAKEANASYLAAPVFGRPDAAAAATLVQVLAGSAEAKKVVSPIIVPAVAKRIVDAGEDAAKGVLEPG